MPVPLPSDDRVRLVPPDATEVALLARGVTSAVRPPGGLTELQRVLVGAQFKAMTGFEIDVGAATPIGAEAFAEGLARRNLAFRTRIVQVMLLCELVLSPLPEEVSDRVERFAAELGVSDGMLGVARGFAAGSYGLAAVDFERNGYTADWGERDAAFLRTGEPLAEAWGLSVDDPDLAARWRSLEELPRGTVGRATADFYRARGFAYPGSPGSAPPLLAQHDWVHVVADYGTTVENELEVFALIARANDDPRAFSLLAMVVSLFETGHLSHGAGLFQADRGHLSRRGMATRLSDAMRRGALTAGSNDFLGMDWFAHADRPLGVVRRELALPDKATAAVRAGSVGPWEPGGISPFQVAAGRRAAAERDEAYDGFGASVAGDGGRA